MKQDTPNTVAVGYAYPTSVTAEALRRGLCGTFYVEIHEDGRCVQTAHATPQAAKAYADAQREKHGYMIAAFCQTKSPRWLELCARFPYAEPKPEAVPA